MNPIFTGKIEKSIIKFDRPNQVNAHLTSLEGQRIELILRKQKSQRSLNQNNYYHGVVIEILSNYCGYEHDEMHEALKEKFLSHQRDEKGLVKIRSTTKLNTADFEEFLEKIKRWAAIELNCYIPNPNMPGGI
jgi:hypothetical protein